MVSVILVPATIVCLVIFIVAALVSAKNQKGDEGMFRQLYVYLVLFATLMMTIGGGIGIFNGVADVVSPSPYINSYSDFKNMQTESNIDQEKPTKNDKVVKVDEKQLRSEYDQYVKDETDRAVKQAKNLIIKSFGFIVIPFPIFLFFNRLRKKKEEA